jgi:hypothetical protein
MTEEPIVLHVTPIYEKHVPIECKTTNPSSLFKLELIRDPGFRIYHGNNGDLIRENSKKVNVIEYSWHQRYGHSDVYSCRMILSNVQVTYKSKVTETGTFDVMYEHYGTFKCNLALKNTFEMFIKECKIVQK